MDDKPAAPATRHEIMSFTTGDGAITLTLPIPLTEMSAGSLHALSNQLAQLALQRRAPASSGGQP